MINIINSLMYVDDVCKLKLYSPIFGDVTIKNIINNEIEINQSSSKFDEFGRIKLNEIISHECMLKPKDSSWEDLVIESLKDGDFLIKKLDRRGYFFSIDEFDFIYVSNKSNNKYIVPGGCINDIDDLKRIIYEYHRLSYDEMVPFYKFLVSYYLYENCNEASKTIWSQLFNNDSVRIDDIELIEKSRFKIHIMVNNNMHEELEIDIFNR